MLDTTSNTIQTDIAIIGAGPAGLYAAFELGLHGLKTHIIDILPFAGGQCTELFGHKPIYDIPAIKKCTGIELTERLLEQLQPFSPSLHLGHLVTELTPLTSNNPPAHTNSGFILKTSQGLALQARCIIIASGVGAFLPRTLPLEGLEPLLNRQIFYTPPQDILSLARQNIVISGDLEETLQAANMLASLSDHRPASVTLIHRRDKFRAEQHTIERMELLRQDHLLHFVAGQVTQLHTQPSSGQLQHIEVKRTDNGETQHIPADILLILHGLSPKLGPIANWGLTLKGKQLVIDMATYQTSMPGVFAIGDAVTYPGKRKLITSCFHEATLAAYGIATYLNHGEPVPLQYTSSSTELQALLQQNP